ncbi:MULTISPECIES: prolyl aminopeptidase [Hyphomonas]|uniref:Proline iminopeptidase n=1 Tax=Hyphomonas adhaerens TaxID=81029 RepID=A0A3B9GUW9_9PROT|nr:MULTISPECIES: prolyl aminopeptidase [Hyphomonas]MBB38763.1 prolyl aminopeptidase [Hyphomonas sp.]HAE26223.1 prolyl aminopeptidase [Hyphomonas adhaerens]|tara:strand:+ start:13329 stop:14318 length:990 start_codon:yes stop_codon:yes gene_type:complete
MNRRPPRRILYPRYEARRSGRLRVSDIHEIYWEESGNPNGVPVVALHGGPGGGSSPEMRRFFDPERYRVFLFDQRGCGRSTPHSELRENTTWDLVDDMEALRDHVGVNQWLVFGGSWGSTLSLAYGVTHPDRTLGLVLRGIFLVSKPEVQWFYQSGASRLFPDSYDRYIAPIPEDERDDLLMAFHRRLTGDDRQSRIEAARAWSRWEGETLSIKGPLTTPPRFNEDDFVDAFARIECHYFVNRGFFASDNWLLEQCAKKLKDIPGVIVHGRYDVVTPLSTAWALSKAWPKAELHIVPDAGHSSMEPGIVDKLIQATDHFAGVYGSKVRA